MKKFYGKIVVALLALIMALGLCACGDNPVDPGDGKDPVTAVKAGQTMSDAIDKLAAGGFTLTANGTIVLPNATFKAENITASFKKTVTDYDFRSQGKLTSEQGKNKDEMSFDLIKVDDKTYVKTTGDTYKGSSFDNEAIDGILQAIDELKGYVGKLEGDLTEKGETYTYGMSLDMGKYMTAAVDFVKTNKDVTIGQFIANMLSTETSKVSPEDLAAMINLYIDKDPTVKGVVGDLEKMLKKVDPSINLETLVNTYATQQGLTPEAIYGMVGGAQSEFPEPKATDTVYGYVMTAVGDMKVMPLVIQLLQEMELPIESVADVKKQVTDLLTSEELTIGNIYDMITGEALTGNEAVNMLVYMTAEEAVIADIFSIEEGNVFGMDFLDKITIGKNTVTVEFTFDKGTKALTAIKVSVEMNVNYKNGEVEGALVKVKADLDIGFTYGEVTITVPDKVVMEEDAESNIPPSVVTLGGEETQLAA